jgi:superfamily II DNA helicase RecQ
MVHYHFIEQGAVSERRGREVRLHAMLRFAETSGCRRKSLLNYFGEELTDPCGHCDNCVRPPDDGNAPDVSPAALKFLACVQETGQRFGAAHLIAVLRGSRPSGFSAAVTTAYRLSAWEESTRRKNGALSSTSSSERGCSNPNPITAFSI